DLDAAARTAAQAYLRLVAERLQEVADVRVTTHLLEGPIAEAIQEQVLLSGAELVVMTTHGRGALARLWLGSVADELVSHLPGPVLLVRPQEGATEPVGNHPLRHVLIPLDGTPLAEQILGSALALAAGPDVEFT